MLPAFTALMMSISLVSSVPPWIGDLELALAALGQRLGHPVERDGAGLRHRVHRGNLHGLRLRLCKGRRAPGGNDAGQAAGRTQQRAAR
jgi:hypothetical protein